LTMAPSMQYDDLDIVKFDFYRGTDICKNG